MEDETKQVPVVKKNMDRHEYVRHYLMTKSGCRRWSANPPVLKGFIDGQRRR